MRPIPPQCVPCPTPFYPRRLIATITTAVNAGVAAGVVSQGGTASLVICYDKSGGNWRLPVAAGMPVGCEPGTASRDIRFPGLLRVWRVRWQVVTVRNLSKSRGLTRRQWGRR